MKTTKLDLGLAIAACVRGYPCKRKNDSNEIMCMEKGHIILKRIVGKDCRLEHSALWLEPTSEEWYLEGTQDKTWLDKDIT